MRLAALSLLTVISTPLLAEHDVPQSYNYIGIHATQHYFDIGGHVPNPDLDDGLLPGVQAGMRRDNWSVQAWWEKADLDIERGQGEVSLRSVFASIRHHYHDDDVLGFEPYTGFTVGDKRFDDAGSDADNETAVGFELGLQKGFSDRFVLDLGLRPTYSTDNERFDGQLYAGINLLIGAGAGGSSTSATAGVDNSPAAAQAQQTQDDTDALRDDDADGISNADDACPDTAEGAKVDAQGCHQALTESIRQTLYIQFETGKAVVKESSYADLERIAVVMREYPETSLVLEGHTDSQGSAALNKQLSQQRAAAARSVLIERFDIAAERVSAVGRGEEQPVASNDTAEGRAKNRRVEALLEASRTVTP